jgi:hypothetical protein
MLALHRVFFGDAQDLRVVLRTWSCPAKDPEVGPLPMTVSVTFWVSCFSNNWSQIKERNIRMNLIKFVYIYVCVLSIFYTYMLT